MPWRLPAIARHGNCHAPCRMRTRYVLPVRRRMVLDQGKVRVGEQRTSVGDESYRPALPLDLGTRGLDSNQQTSAHPSRPPPRALIDQARLRTGTTEGRSAIDWRCGDQLRRADD